MSKYKEEFTLKQHTPIIHFQSSQAGATLRATELKPKLDRFLLAMEPELPCRENANGSLSLDYKVSIEPDMSLREEIDGKKFPLFFGNMKPKKLTDEEWLILKKRFKFSKEPLKIRFFTFNDKVREAISEHFERFIAQTNFGTRQSKGFGSFYLFEDDGSGEKPFDPSLIPYRVYRFKSREAAYQEDIKVLYSFLRQGINEPKGQENCPQTGFYTKPAIFSYAKKQGWTWDKKVIKQTFFPETLEDQIICRENADVLTYEGEEACLLRDLFGLSAEQSWKSYGKSVNKQGSRMEPQGNQEVPVIQRFKSPITFKPIVDDAKRGTMTVYFWADDSVEKILDEPFIITVSGEEETLELSTPASFSFDDFFDFAFGIELSRHIAGEFHEHRHYKRLRRIIQSIKESK